LTLYNNTARAFTFPSVHSQANDLISSTFPICGVTFSAMIVLHCI